MFNCTTGAPCEKHRRWTPSGAFFMMELKDCLKSGTCFHSGCRLNRSSYKSITVTSVPGCTWEVQRNWSGSKTFGTMRGNISCHKSSARCSNAELLSQNWSWGNERHRGTEIANWKPFADFHFTVLFYLICYQVQYHFKYFIPTWNTKFCLEPTVG